MADTPPYRRRFSFTGAQANDPSAPLPGIQVDRELDDIADRLSKVAQSNYELAVLNGFTGTLGDYLLSLVGPPGGPGEQGPKGTIDDLPVSIGGVTSPPSPYLSKIVFGQPPVLDMFGPYRDGVRADEPLINQILDGHNTCLVKPSYVGGTGPVFVKNSPIKVPPNGLFSSLAGKQRALILRDVGYSGDTLQAGSPTVSCGSAKVKGFYLVQPNRVLGTYGSDATITNRLTGGQAHARWYGGQGHSMEDCAVSGMPYGVVCLGGYGFKLTDLDAYGGVWDSRIPMLQESIAVFATMYDPVHLYPGVVTVTNPQWVTLNRSVEQRVIGVGNKTYTAQERTGPLYGWLHASGERCQMTGGFLQGFNRYCIGVFPGGPAYINGSPAWVQIGLQIIGVGLDESMLGIVGALRNDPATALMQDMLLQNCTMNGQLVTPYCLDFSIGDQSLHSVACLTVQDCVGTAFQGAANRLYSVDGGVMDGNQWRGYNAAGFDTSKGDAPDFGVGTMVKLATRDMMFKNERFGGGANRSRDPNNTQWGLFDATSGQNNRYYGVEGLNFGLAGGGATYNGTKFTP